MTVWRAYFKTPAKLTVGFVLFVISPTMCILIFVTLYLPVAWGARVRQLVYVGIQSFLQKFYI